MKRQRLLIVGAGLVILLSVLPSRASARTSFRISIGTSLGQHYRPSDSQHYRASDYGFHTFYRSGHKGLSARGGRSRSIFRSRRYRRLGGHRCTPKARIRVGHGHDGYSHGHGCGCK